MIPGDLDRRAGGQPHRLPAHHHVPDGQKTSALGIVAGFGALFATVGNVLFGRFSDRTTSRWGRRRPWIVGGTVVMTLAFLIMALGNSVAVVTVGWCLAQLGANAAFGPFLATIALPQTAAPVVGATLLAVGSVANQNYTLMLYVAGALALIGALVVLPIKGVR
jgi:MFS family permease